MAILCRFRESGNCCFRSGIRTGPDVDVRPSDKQTIYIYNIRSGYGVDANLPSALCHLLMLICDLLVPIRLTPVFASSLIPLSLWAQRRMNIRSTSTSTGPRAWNWGAKSQQLKTPPCSQRLRRRDRLRKLYEPRARLPVRPGGLCKRR